MSYQAALLELRQILADSDQDKRSTQKRLVGNVDGNNTIFTTYDKKIYADTLVVFQNINNGGPEEIDTWNLNDPIAGEIQFEDAPAVNTVLTATYYWQWLTDVQLTNYLNKAAEIIGLTDPNAQTGTATNPNDKAYLQIPAGLKNATLNVAGSYGFKAIAAYMVARRHSGEYLLEQDGNDDDGYSKLIDNVNKMAAQYLKDGMMLRDDFYKAQGRQYIPTQQIKIVGTRNYGPRR